MKIWQIWVIVALVSIIIEIFTSGFAVACFSVGCILAAKGTVCKLGLSWQILLFAIGLFSLLSLSDLLSLN